MLAYVFLLLIPSTFLGFALVFCGEEVAHSMTTQGLRTGMGPISWGTNIHTTGPVQYVVPGVYFANDNFNSHINKPRQGYEACLWARVGVKEGPIGLAVGV